MSPRHSATGSCRRHRVPYTRERSLPLFAHHLAHIVAGHLQPLSLQSHSLRKPLLHLLDQRIERLDLVRLHRPDHQSFDRVLGKEFGACFSGSLLRRRGSSASSSAQKGLCQTRERPCVAPSMETTRRHVPEGQCQGSVLPSTVATAHPIMGANRQRTQRGCDNRDTLLRARLEGTTAVESPRLLLLESATENATLVLQDGPALVRSPCLYTPLMPEPAPIRTATTCAPQTKHHSAVIRCPARVRETSPASCRVAATAGATSSSAIVNVHSLPSPERPGSVADGQRTPPFDAYTHFPSWKSAMPSVSIQAFFGAYR